MKRKEWRARIKNNRRFNWLNKYYSNRWNRYYDWVIKYFSAKTKKERTELIKKEGLYLP